MNKFLDSLILLSVFSVSSIFGELQDVPPPPYPYLQATYGALFKNPSLIEVEQEDVQYLNHIKEALYCIRYLEEQFHQKGYGGSESCLDDPKHLAKILQLSLDVRHNEALFPDHYQFVTAQTSHYFAYQTIAEELYRRAGHTIPEHCRLLRYPSPNLTSNLEEFYQKYPLVIEEQDLEELSDILTQSDVNPDVGRQIISANLTMETHWPYDSTLWIFIEGKGALRIRFFEEEGIEIPSTEQCFKGQLRELFETAGVPTDQIEPYLDELISRAPQTREGIVNQIFIPKERAREFLYVSEPGGYVAKAANDQMEETFAKFQADRLQEDFENDNLQVRILAGKLLDEDVRIFRYTLIPTEVQKAYAEYVSIILDQIHRDARYKMCKM